ncbi:MAG TPA: SBBP repeat-containing protein, partial [Bacteroidia bacterium]|nr:SBBP repeat-containing protein [Bacteroidia bacterium]
MKKTLAFTFLFFHSLFMHAQIPPLDWAENAGGSASDKGNAVCIDATGNVYVTGSFISMPADLDPGSGNTATLNQGMEDVFVLKLNPSGSLAWAKTIGGAGSDIGYGIAVNSSGNVFVSGSFSQTVDFDPG